jgi:predicted sulfurtransferase
VGRIFFQDLSAAQLSPNVICCNAAVSCCEKASQWLMALGFLQMWQAMADVISY